MTVANRDLMRAINRFSLLHAIRDAGAISRVELARKTGLSQATITGISSELLKEGLLVEHSNGLSQGGRKPVPLALNPSGAFSVGLHLSLSRVCSVLMDLQGNILNTYSKPLATRTLTPDHLSTIITEAVQACLWEADFSKKQISGIGVAIPGLIDSRNGFVHFIPNYQMKDLSLAEQLRQRIGIPVYVENSANALIIYEQWFGFGRGTDNFLLITTENGIGMGLVLDGKIYRGQRGIAGEFGHTVVEDNGPLCRCGQRGCLEAICGNNAIIREAALLAEQGLWQSGNPAEISIEEIIAAARAGNPALGRIYQKAGSTLGRGITNMVRLFDPERIIICGKGVLAGELLLAPLQQQLSEDIGFTSDKAIQIFIQPWQPSLYARAAGALVLQEVYQSPANRVVPII